MISIEEKDKIKGIKIHRSFQEEIKKYLEQRKNNKYLIEILKSLKNTLTLMNTREQLIKNKIGTLAHYHNYKKMIQKISNEIKNDKEKEELIVNKSIKQIIKEKKIGKRIYIT